MDRSSRIVVLGSLSLVTILAIVGLWRLTQNRSPQPEVSDLIASDQIASTASAPQTRPASLAVTQTAALNSNPKTAAAKVALLEEILSSRNDNDPRLDTELRTLDAAAKDAFQKRYAAYSPERRNERGTIVFLLGRNLTEARDFAFMKEVLTEAPCLSLGNCAQSAQGGDPHLESATEVTLAYPQLVALKQIENFLQRRDLSRPDLIQEARKAIEAAKASGNSKVAEMARELEKRI